MKFVLQSMLVILFLALAYFMSGVILSNMAMDIRLHDVYFQHDPFPTYTTLQGIMTATLAFLGLAAMKKFRNRGINLILVGSAFILITSSSIIYLILSH